MVLEDVGDEVPIELSSTEDAFGTCFSTGTSEGGPNKGWLGREEVDSEDTCGTVSVEIVVTGPDSVKI